MLIGVGVEAGADADGGRVEVGAGWCAVAVAGLGAEVGLSELNQLYRNEPADVIISRLFQSVVARDHGDVPPPLCGTFRAVECTVEVHSTMGDLNTSSGPHKWETLWVLPFFISSLCLLS